MRDFVVDLNSAHCKFILKYSEKFTADLPDNFCDYWRLFLVTLLKMFVAAAIVGLIIGFTIGKLIVSPVATVSFFGVVGILFGITYLVAYYAVQRKKRRQRGEIPQHGLIKTKYLSWKAKVCPRVKYVEDSNA